jgi:hypothetical protein
MNRDLAGYPRAVFRFEHPIVVLSPGITFLRSHGRNKIGLVFGKDDPWRGNPVQIKFRYLHNLSISFCYHLLL